MNIKLKNKIRIISNEKKITVREFLEQQVYVDQDFKETLVGRLIRKRSISSH